MTRQMLVLRAVPALAVCALTAMAFAETLSISDIMKKAHRGRDATVQKAIRGEATKEELQTLISYYKSMVTQKPPRGDDASWKEKTEALIKAATAVSEGAADAGKQLQTAASCKECHSAHRPME